MLILLAALGIVDGGAGNAEFRGQVSAGLATANSMTAGSTLVDRGAGGGDGGNNGGNGNNRW